jgi:hypothetical protein
MPPRWLYWPTLLSGNVILVMLEEYNESGYFSMCGRWLDAAKQLLKQLLVASVFGAVIAILLVARECLPRST